jgi:hypothetical protein
MPESWTGLCLRGLIDGLICGNLSRPRRRYSYWTYLRISFGIFIIAGFNYVFTKLIDKLYGNFDFWSVYGLFLLILLFILGFALYLLIFDRKGTIARMLGAGKEESGTATATQNPTSNRDLFFWIAFTVSIVSAVTGAIGAVASYYSVQLVLNPYYDGPLGSSVYYARSVAVTVADKYPISAYKTEIIYAKGQVSPTPTCGPGMYPIVGQLQVRGTVDGNPAGTDGNESGNTCDGLVFFHPLIIRDTPGTNLGVSVWCVNSGCNSTIVITATVHLVR